VFNRMMAAFGIGNIVGHGGRAGRGVSSVPSGAHGSIRRGAIGV
jgi:hypothetical protein